MRGCGRVLALASLTLGACQGRQSILDSTGAQAERIAGLWWLMFPVCGAVWLAVMAVLGWAIWRTRGRLAARPDEPDLKPEPERERRLGRSVALAIGATVAILLVFTVSSYSVSNALYKLATPGALKIEVTGHQWWWEVRYHDAIASNIITDANEIHIPVGERVQIELQSSDVIHSFWIPNLHGKRDLIPGQTNELWIQADRTGTFRGQCAEFCGVQHAKMAMIVVAHSKEEFEVWRQQQRQLAAEPTDPVAAHGQEVFMTGPCIMCHAIAGTQAGGRAGPDLTHFASRQTIAAGTLPNTRGHLAGWILDPQHIKPGVRMPTNLIEAADVNPLVIYLQSLK